MGFLNINSINRHRLQGVFFHAIVQVLALAGHADFKDLNDFLVRCTKKIGVCALGGRDQFVSMKSALV